MLLTGSKKGYIFARKIKGIEVFRQPFFPVQVNPPPPTFNYALRIHGSMSTEERERENGKCDRTRFVEVGVTDSRVVVGFLSNGGIHKGGGGYSMGRMESIMAAGSPPPPPCQCVRTRINRRNQSRSSIGLRESPLSPWSQFNPGGLSNTGSQRPHDYPTSRELSAFSLSLSLGFHPFVCCARGVSIVRIRCTQDKEWARTASSKTNTSPSVKLASC